MSTVKPALYLDACAILDIVRDPRRRDIRRDHQDASILLLEAAEADELDIFVNSLVRTEFADNVHNVERDAQRGLNAITADVAKIDALVDLHGSPGRADIRHWSGHISRCRRVADRWLTVGKDAPESDVIRQRALARVIQRRPPSRRGKDSTKDCLILETYLEHARNARCAGLRERAVFVSSNTTDYAKSEANLPEELASELNAVRLNYAPNMAAAHSLVWA